jgi:tetratricopeptide (TPR) repeat protein
MSLSGVLLQCARYTYGVSVFAKIVSAIFFYQRIRIPSSVLAPLFLLICFCCSRVSLASENEWIEVRSQHFRVLSDGSDKDARRMAREFEQMRAVFSRQFPTLRLDSGAPLLVLAVRDENSMKALVPALWKTKGAKPAGIFQRGWEKSFALVRLDTVSQEDYEVIYHEYTHSFIHMNYRLCPLWLDEGLADFFANTRFQKDKIYIGVPSRHMRTSFLKPLIPLDVLLSVTQRSPYYHDEGKVQSFYAQSWALTHFLMLSPEMDHGKRLGKYFQLLQAGGDRKKIFEEAIGDPTEIQAKLDRYTSQSILPVAVLDTPPQTLEAEFASRRLSAAETEAELSTFHLWEHDKESARKLLKDALKADGKMALAHENMGFLYFSEGRDAEAFTEFNRAYELDGKLYLALFYRTMLSPIPRSDLPADREKFKDALMKVLDLNPQFAPAYIQYAFLELRQGNPEHALGLSRRAEMLEPARAGYHIFSGHIMLQLGRVADAALFARYVAERWEGADHNEAVELWNAIPAAQRPENVQLAEAAPEGATTIRGRIKSVTCGDKDHPSVTIVIEHDGQQYSFLGKERWRVGFSDTLWYGEDHFGLCHHLVGLQAIIGYRPSTGKSYTGDLEDVEIRDDFPVQVPIAGEQPKDAGKAQCKLLEDLASFPPTPAGSSPGSPQAIAQFFPERDALFIKLLAQSHAPQQPAAFLICGVPCMRLN